MGLSSLVLFGLVYIGPLVVFTTYGIVTHTTGGRLTLAYWCHPDGDDLHGVVLRADVGDELVAFVWIEGIRRKSTPRPPCN